MSRFIKKASLLALAGIVALGVAVAPGAASAQLTQSQIDAIVSLLQSFGADATTVSNVTAALQGQPTGGTPTGGGISGIPAGFTFTTNLTVGSTGDDVRYLQILLNSDSATRVAESGAGSPGSETTTFGPLTAAAVVKFQDKYASEVLGPVGLSAGTGYFGSSSRAKANALLGGTTPGQPGEPQQPSTPGQINVTVSGPAASTIVANQATANLGNFVLSGNGTVTMVKLQRIGISADTSLDNVFLFDGTTRLTDAGSVSANSEITFSNPSGLFTVSGSRTISVRADINSLASAGETIGVRLLEVTLSSGTVGGLPVSGNLHNVSTVALASASLANATASGDTDPGTDVLVWQGDLNVQTRDLTMTRLALRQLGSISQNDINNFRLYIAGVQVAQTQNLDANRYVTFSLNQTVTTGVKNVRVLADIVGGSGRTVQMSLRGAYDITLADSQVAGANVRTSGTPFGPATAFTVSEGVMTVTKTADSPSSNVVLAGTDVPLARYTFTAFGEPIKVETLTVRIIEGTLASDNLRQGRILVNGSQVGSTTTLIKGAAGTEYNTNFTVMPGSPATVEVRADIVAASGNAVAEGNDFMIRILQGNNNGIPQESLTPVDVPTANADANTVIVASGAITMPQNTNYGNQNVVVPQNQGGGFKLADFNLTNSNVETVNVNTFTLTFTSGGGGGTFGAADLQNVYIKYGNSTTSIRPTVSAGQTYSVTLALAPNQVVPVQVWGNILSGNVTEDDTLIVNVAVSATTASGQAANLGAQAGQTLTAKDAGSIVASLNAQSPVAQLVDDNKTVATGVFNFTSANESFTVTDVTVTLGSASAVQNVILKNAATGAPLRTRPGATTVTFNDIVLPVEANGTSAILVEAQLGTIGVGAGSTGSSIQTTLTAATAKNAQGASVVVAGLASGVNGNAIYAYASIPTITNVALPSTDLIPSSEWVMSKFSVTAMGGTVEWKKIIFEVTKTASKGVIITQGDLKLYSRGADGTGTRQEVPGAFTVATLGDGNTAGTVSFVATNAEQLLGGSRVYELVEVNGSAVSGTGTATLSTRIAQPSSFAASDTYANTSGGAETFVWSDVSAQLHSTLTSDWANDNLVESLPTSVQTLQINLGS